MSSGQAAEVAKDKFLIVLNRAVDCTNSLVIFEQPIGMEFRYDSTVHYEPYHC